MLFLRCLFLVVVCCFVLGAFVLLVCLGVGGASSFCFSFVRVEKKEARRKGQVRNVNNKKVKERVDAKHAFDGNGVLLLHEACADRALHDRDCDQEVRDMW